MNEDLAMNMEASSMHGSTDCLAESLKDLCHVIMNKYEGKLLAVHVSARPTCKC